MYLKCPTLLQRRNSSRLCRSVASRLLTNDQCIAKMKFVAHGLAVRIVVSKDVFHMNKKKRTLSGSFQFIFIARFLMRIVYHLRNGLAYGLQCFRIDIFDVVVVRVVERTKFIAVEAHAFG